MRRQGVVAVLVAGLLGAARADARVWTSASGKFQIEAELDESRPDGTLRLRRPDGQLVEVKLKDLSVADQTYVARRSAPPKTQPPTAPPAASKPRPPVSGASGPVARPAPGPIKIEKHPVPAAAEVEKKQKELRALIKEDYDKTGFNERMQLYSKLMQWANESVGKDPTGAYAFADEAANIGGVAGLLQSAYFSLEWLEKNYQIDDIRARKLRLLGSVKVDSLPPFVVSQVLNECQSLKDKARLDADVEMLDLFGRLATRLAIRSDRPGYREMVETWIKQWKEERSLYTEAKAAMDKLAADPQDAEANLTVGKFRCLVCERWDAGIENLAAGSDADLAGIAKAEIEATRNGFRSTTDRLAIADRWWDASESLKNRKDAAALKRRSGFWYQMARHDLAALDRVRVDKRLEAIHGSPSNAYAHQNVRSHIDSRGNAYRDNGDADTVELRQLQRVYVSGGEEPRFVYGSLHCPLVSGKSVRHEFRTNRRYLKIQGSVSIEPSRQVDENGAARPGTPPGVVFTLYADKRRVWKSQPLHLSGTTKVNFKGTLRNAERIQLIAEGVGSGNGDINAIWGGVVVSKK